MARKVIIYGGSGGIGSATGRILRARGYDLRLVGRSEGKLAAIAAELEASFTIGEVTDSARFSRVTKEAGEPLEGLVYAVGTINLRSLQRLTENAFLNDFRVNAMGAALAVQAAFSALKKSPKVAPGCFSPALRRCRDSHFMLRWVWQRGPWQLTGQGILGMRAAFCLAQEIAQQLARSALLLGAMS
ncbi:MAG: SDR family NAD(P)-dependent oxidoreductase [Candidatus Binatia bacterium]